MSKLSMTNECWHCGADLGEEVPVRDMEVCNDSRCSHERADAFAAREEAHDELDRQMGYDAVPGSWGW